MFNSVVLDVFIGLVLIYLLYSLLVTIISEIVANWLGLRARMLRLSIEKMLNDGYFANSGNPKYRGFWFIVQRFFLKEFEDFKFSMAGKFYSYPSIKYLVARAGEQTTPLTETKPSYISDENFSDTLIQMLKDRGAGDTDMEKIKFTLEFNTQNIQPGTLQRLRDLSENAADDIDNFKKNLKAWYQETQDRNTGWYKRKLQAILFLLGFIVAIVFNVDSLRIAKILAKDEKARDQLVSMGIELAKDSARYAEFLKTNDSALAKAIIDSGYKRVTRDLEDANMVLGLGWGTDKLRKTKKVTRNSKDDGAAFVRLDTSMKLFQRLQKDVDSSKRSLVMYHDSVNNTLVELSLLGIDSLKTDSTRPFRLKADSLKKQLRAYTARLHRDSLVILNGSSLISRITDTVNKVLDVKFTDIDKIDTLNKATIEVTGRRHYSWDEKLWHAISGIPGGFFGFLITGLMLSLGAPFWFDLLKKLVSMRGDGVKPEEKKGNPNEIFFTESVGVLETGAATGANTALQGAGTTSREHVEQALRNLTQRIKSEKGIVAVAIEHDANDQPFLMVMAESAAVQHFLSNKYGGTEKLGDEFTIPVQYTVEDNIAIQAARDGGEICNEERPQNSGTLGCHLQKKGSDKVFFISCWHVMKDNIDWNVAPLNPTIVDVAGKKTLGRIESGFLSHDTAIGIDMGIASYIVTEAPLKNDQLPIKSQHRSVTAFDSLVQTKVKLFGKSSGFKEAVIFHDKINARIRYHDGSIHLLNDVFSITIKDPADKTKKSSPTTEGDSGAVVTDADGVPLGMIVGGNTNFSYVMKFSNVFGTNKPFSDFSFKI